MPFLARLLEEKDKLIDKDRVLEETAKKLEMESREMYEHRMGKFLCLNIPAEDYNRIFKN